MRRRLLPASAIPGGSVAGVLLYLLACGSPYSAEEAAPDAGGPDAASPGDFTIEPPSVELAPGQNATLRVHGAKGATVAFTVAADPPPGGGKSPDGSVKVSAPAVTVEANGEATVDVRAAADAPQQRFHVTAMSGDRSHPVDGRVIGRPGDLDAFFGDHAGYFDFAAPGECEGYAVGVLPDGKFLVVGRTREPAVLFAARFSGEGKLDDTFGPIKGGKRSGWSTFATTGKPDNATLALRPNGGLAVGAVGTEPAADSPPRIYVLGADGSPDAKWGAAAGIDPQVKGTSARHLPVAASGDAIVVGGILNGDNAEIRRFANGALDTSFGTNGAYAFAVGEVGTAPTGPQIAALVVEKSGAVWAAGHYIETAVQPVERAFVRRVDANAKAVQANTDGIPGSGMVMTLQDDKAVVGTYDFEKKSAFAFRATQGIDPTFGSAGIAPVTTTAEPGVPSSIATEPNGNVLLVIGGVLAKSFDVYRLGPNGARDVAFGKNGRFSMLGRAEGLAITGRYLLVVGANDPTDPRSARIARLWL